jgi:hypothetical protein
MGELMAEHVHILALGPSWYKCPEEKVEGEEIWAVNTMYRNRPADRVYIMHDLRHDILLMDKDFVHNVNQMDIPVYTAGDYPSFKNNVVYPIEDVLNEFRVAFFLNVMCYMIAHAIMEGVKKISLWGTDMRSDAGHEYRINEKGAVEFWLGVAIGRGVEIAIPEESYLLKRIMTGNFYGYTPRQAPDGLLYLIPENIRREHHHFRLTPLDRDGNDLKEYSVTTRLHYDQPQIIE